MSCRHSNPAGHTFCSTCGERLPHFRCQCGFACDTNDAFCGRCGAKVLCAQNETGGSRIALPSGKYNLTLLKKLAGEAMCSATLHPAKITQGEIRRMLRIREETRA